MKSPISAFTTSLVYITGNLNLLNSWPQSTDLRYQIAMFITPLKLNLRHMLINYLANQLFYTIAFCMICVNLIYTKLRRKRKRKIAKPSIRQSMVVKKWLQMHLHHKNNLIWSIFKFSKNQLINALFSHVKLWFLL